MDLEAIKRANRIEDVVRETTGWTMTGRGSILSTREHDSLKVFVESQTYKWFSQHDHHGDVIAWLEKYNGWDFRQAVEWLCERAGIPVDWKGVDMAAWRATKTKREALTVMAEFFHAAFLRTAPAREWAAARGWTDETMAAARLGYWRSALRDELIGHLQMHEVDLNTDVVLAVLGDPKRRIRGIPDDFVIYPHWDGGRCVYLSCRTIRKGDKKAMAAAGYPAHHNLNQSLVGDKLPFKNASYRHGSRHLVLVEGQADAITLAQWGIPAVALAGMVGKALNEFLEGLRGHHDRIYIAMDAEKRGTAAHDGVMSSVRKLGAVLGAGTAVVRWPHGDANDWLQAGGDAVACQELLASSPCLAVFLAEEARQAEPMEQQFAEREAVEAAARLDDYTYADNRLALAKLLAGGQVSVMDRKRRAAQAQLPAAELEPVTKAATSAERVGVALGVKLPDDVMIRGKLKAAPADHEGHAQCVLALYPAQFAWVAEWGWLHWDGRHWERTQKDASAVKRAIVETLRTRAAVAVEAQDDHLLKACNADAHEVNGVLQMVQAMVVARPEQFDCYPDHLNCQNGVVDLRTGELIEHDSGWRFTTMVDVAYKAGLKPELWRKYLWESVWDASASEEENTEKIRWLWMFCGYLLTGHIKEQIFVYLHGPPRSGKGLFTQTLQKLLGRPLSIETDMDMFTSTGADTNNFHLAPLSGARLVVASETEKHKRMNGAVVKSLTGGDSIYASYKGLTHFNFNPVFKILMSSNWPVNVDAEDEAVWARLRVVTFPTSKVGNEDKGLGSRLSAPAALEGLLSWCVAGAVAWYKAGQSLPYPAVLQRTAQAMRGEQDIVGLWMDDACSILEPGTEAAFTPISLLYKHYAGWCKDAGIRPKNRNSFTSALEAKGYKKAKRAHDIFKTTGWGYHGIALNGDGDDLGVMRQEPIPL